MCHCADSMKLLILGTRNRMQRAVGGEGVRVHAVEPEVARDYALLVRRTSARIRART